MKARLEDTSDVIGEEKKRANNFQEVILIPEGDNIETQYTVFFNQFLSYLLFCLGKRLPTNLKKASFGMN